MRCSACKASATARAAARFGLAEAVKFCAQAPRSLLPGRKCFCAVKFGQQFELLLLVTRRKRQNGSIATMLDGLGRQLLQQRRLLQRQQISPVAQRHTSQRLERAPDAQAYRIGLGRQGNDQYGKHVEWYGVEWYGFEMFDTVFVAIITGYLAQRKFNCQTVSKAVEILLTPGMHPDALQLAGKSP